MLDLENEDITNKKWWKRTRKEIKESKEEFIRSGKIGGNPLGVNDNLLKSEVLKDQKGKG